MFCEERVVLENGDKTLDSSRNRKKKKRTVQIGQRENGKGGRTGVERAGKNGEPPVNDTE